MERRVNRDVRTTASRCAMASSRAESSNARHSTGVRGGKWGGSAPCRCSLGLAADLDRGPVPANKAAEPRHGAASVLAEQIAAVWTDARPRSGCPPPPVCRGCGSRSSPQFRGHLRVWSGRRPAPLPTHPPQPRHGSPFVGERKNAPARLEPGTLYRIEQVETVAGLMIDRPEKTSCQSPGYSSLAGWRTNIDFWNIIILRRQTYVRAKLKCPP
jgi:hypothetical protein